MRDITEREINLIKDGVFDVACKVKIEDIEGIYRDLTQLDNQDWVNNISLRTDLDTDAITGTIEIIRERFKKSLVNLITNSKFNIDEEGDYSPLVDISRNIKISFALYKEDEDPLQENYYNEFIKAEINDINWDSNPMTLDLKDVVMSKMDYTFIEEEKDMVVDEDGEPIEEGQPVTQVMQDILDDWNTGLDLYVIEDPVYNVEPYELEKQSVRQAIEELYLLLGWQVRTRKIEGEYRPTLIPVEREKEEIDFEFENYGTIENYEKDNRDIRNKVKVVYETPDGDRENVTVVDNESIQEHGKRFMEITEGTFSQIYDWEKAEALANYALEDLKNPHLDKSVYAPFFPFVHIGDKYRFKADGIHSDVDQELYVVGYNLVLGTNDAHIRLDVRGQNSVKYEGWLNRDGRPGVGEPNPEKPPKAVQDLFVFSDYEMLDDGTVTPYIKAEWNRPRYSEFNRANVFMREKENNSWTTWGRIDVVVQDEYIINNVETGIYEIKIVAEDSHGNTGDFNEAPTREVEVEGKTDKPEPVEFDKIEWKKDRIKITWHPHSDSDFDQYEIRLDKDFGSDY